MMLKRAARANASLESSSAWQPSRLLLQRKCSCGRSAAGGECAECRLEEKPLTKLRVAPAGDRYEVEADRVAREVTSTDSASQGRPRISRLSPSERSVQADQAGTASSEAASSAASVADSGGTPLSAGLRRSMESRFQHSFSEVRVHADSQAAQAAQDLGARAFTVGRHIAFGRGQFEPVSQSGRELLAHELVHVVQQDSAGRAIQRMSPGTGTPPVTDNDDYSEVKPDEKERVEAAIALVRRVADSPKKFPRCHKFFETKCASGTATTFKENFDKTKVWFDKDNTVFGSSKSPHNIAYSSETWRWGRWSLAGVFIHEMMHMCGQDDEAIDDEAITTCGFPDIAAYKAGKKDATK